MRGARGAIGLLLPAALLNAGLLLAPLAIVIFDSFQRFEPGTVGATASAPLTWDNYLELARPSYSGYFFDTLRISFIASILSVVMGYLLAYRIVRAASKIVQRFWLGLLIALVFISTLVRMYSIELTFGPVGFLRNVTWVVGVNPRSGLAAEILVTAGLLHYLIPLAALTLIGTVQNINPRLGWAAETLGASRVDAILSIIVPLSGRGLISAFLICYTLSASAFVIPLILGKGEVLFVSNLIYNRFSEIADYPSGAALATVLLLLSVLIIYGISRLFVPLERRI